MPPETTFPTLASLVAPVPVSAFIADYWEREALYVPAASEARPVVSLAEIDRVLTTGVHRHPDLMLVDAAREVSVDEYATDDNVINMAKAIKRFSQGASFVLNRLDEWLPQVRELCVKLEAELGIAAQANMYLTPAAAQGFAVHYDSHDVLILQCAGRKTWKLFDSPAGLPMRGERFERATTPTGALTATFETKPGDALYIPRGLMHEALAADGEASLHVTVGFHAVRWSEVLVEALAQATLADPGLRRGLPLGALTQGALDGALDDALRTHLARIADAVRWKPVRERLVDTFVDNHKESLAGMLLDAASPAGEGAAFARRAGVVTALEDDGDAVVLTINGRATRWPAHAAPTLRRALALPRFTLDALGDEIDLRGRLTLARKLVVEGALRVEAP